ncbi:hypothetical protein T439DRAFT_316439 [Meredithblackwellia eburnea MCA 4105]
MFRKKFVAFFKRQNPGGSQPSSVETSNTPGSTPVLSVTSTTSPLVVRTGAIGGSAGGTAPPSSTSGQATTDRERRRRRRRRRSRDSVVGLPLYTEDPLDEEMVLVKHRPSTDTRYSESVDVLSYANNEDEDEGDNSSDDELGVDLAEDGDGERRLRPSMETSRSFASGRPRSSSDVPSVGTSSGAGFYSTTLYPDRSPLSTAIDIPSPSAALSRVDSNFPSSSSLSASGSPRSSSRLSYSTTNLELAAQTGSVTPPRPSQTRSRASTLRSIFARNGSSTFLSADAGITAGRSPYGQTGGSGNASRSTARLASGSSVSLASISAPLQHTLVTSSFVPPKAGLSPQQMSFISSRESLGAFGFGPGAEPPGFDDGEGATMRRDRSRSEPPPPPLLAARGRSTSVSSAQYSATSPSPLRRLSAASPPPSPGSLSPRSPNQQEGNISSASSLRMSTTQSDLDEISTDPTLKLSDTTVTQPPVPSDTYPPLPASPAASHQSSPSLSTSSPTEPSAPTPKLPQLQLLQATPSNSAAPSPIIPDSAEMQQQSHERYFETLLSRHPARDFSAISEASFTTDASYATARQSSE